MDEFQSFCYLDVQKTGSTFVSKVLKTGSREPLYLSIKHGAISGNSRRNLFGLIRRPGHFRRGVFYFNSVRNPFDYYASLYNYGCDGRGGLAKNLRQGGFGELYGGTVSSFYDWFSFLNDPKNSHYIHHEFTDCGARLGIGFLSYRFLRLSVVDPTNKLSALALNADLRTFLSENGICSKTIRNETLNEDLLHLFDGVLSHAVDLNKVADLLNGQRINASQSGIVTAEHLRRNAASNMVYEADRLIFDAFYR